MQARVPLTDAQEILEFLGDFSPESLHSPRISVAYGAPSVPMCAERADVRGGAGF